MSRSSSSQPASAAPPRPPQAVLDALTRGLVEHPEASLAELARTVGIGRTTLHRLYPTREAVVQAVALDALARLREVDGQVGLHTAFRAELPAAESWEIMQRWIGALVPLGPRLMFLLRSRELDTDPHILQGAAELDGVLQGALERAQQRGEVQPRLSSAWLMASLHALIYAAWEQVAAGTLARRDAAGLVFRTWLGGVGRVE